MNRTERQSTATEPNGPRRRPRRHDAGFTLLECIAVIVIVGILMSMVMKVTLQCWGLARQSMSQAWMGQESVMLSQRWQQFVHRCDNHEWSANDSRFVAGERQAHCVDGRLLLYDNDTRIAELALPRGMTATFAVDTPADLAACAVLNLSWHEKHGKHQIEHSVRLVACAPSRDQETLGSQ